MEETQLESKGKLLIRRFHPGAYTMQFFSLAEIQLSVNKQNYSLNLCLLLYLSNERKQE